MNSNRVSIPAERIEGLILLIRGQRVMLDSDLAKLYEVTTSNLNKAVRRNPERFPSDFMFQLNASEYRSLRFQFGILKRGQHSKCPEGVPLGAGGGEGLKDSKNVMYIYEKHHYPT